MILKSPRRRLGLALVLAFTCVVGTAHAKNLDSLKQVIAGMEPGMALAEVHLELAEACNNRALYSDALVECEQALELVNTKTGSAYSAWTDEKAWPELQPLNWDYFANGGFKSW